MKEIILTDIYLFNDAVKAAEKWLTDTPLLPKWGIKWTQNIKNAGYVIGRTTNDNKCWWHIDYDDAKGLHINALDNFRQINQVYKVSAWDPVPTKEKALSRLAGWWFEMTVVYQTHSMPEEARHNIEAASKGDGLDAQEASKRLQLCKNTIKPSKTFSF